ncbi:MAG TPA: BrnT family toxin [Chloroflexota bacterium]|nr:BrnT family toxin [Chloroflexota bacterium]HUM71144.1 BrnT family toxin [Chloroflexota bacterium]
MSYEWDPGKAEINRLKHGVHFADAVAVLEDEHMLWQEDIGNYDEDRFVAIGVDHLGQILTVVFTFRGDSIRLISARNATKNEQRAYERSRS